MIGTSSVSRTACTIVKPPAAHRNVIALTPTLITSLISAAVLATTTKAGQRSIRKSEKRVKAPQVPPLRAIMTPPPHASSGNGIHTSPLLSRTVLHTYLLPSGEMSHMPLSDFPAPWHHPGYKAPTGNYGYSVGEGMMRQRTKREAIDDAYARTTGWRNRVTGDQGSGEGNARRRWVRTVRGGSDAYWRRRRVDDAAVVEESVERVHLRMLEVKPLLLIR
ncbi:hypothetical protein EK21DRAFT_94813 [Setomelanomma holmii]|uniref:Uncharacterized protein n=1 Tax=Setomelanomma holmii TaxID=210430 RepID=A0A9P4GVP9_9PLEO|nr:hypothetical protein EK21DRAFT_94813 [Setomelanomma holmii]